MPDIFIDLRTLKKQRIQARAHFPHVPIKSQFKVNLLSHIQRQMISAHNQAMLHNVKSKHIGPWYAHWILWKSQSRKPLLFV